MELLRTLPLALKIAFTEDRITNQHFRQVWPARSPDLNPCDFWLWSLLKQLVDHGKAKTLSEVNDNISRHTLSIF